jgi:hypothetical protein
LSLAAGGIHAAEQAEVVELDVFSAAPCKASGDGTYVEIITTMASVLPQEEADAFLAQYCEACFKQKFVVSQTR